ncbi:unnamed protein product [Symbiodinium microadriaticum]|nr:unnamed protein product [Symbiodinium microadriaticum]
MGSLAKKCRNLPWPDAVALLQKALHAKEAPNIAAYTSVIAACGKRSNWSMAVGLLQDARSRQLRPDMPALNSALTALGRAGRWREATMYLDLAKSWCLHPSPVSFGALLDALARATRWQRALCVLDDDDTAVGLIAFNSALTACERASEWGQAIQLLHEMREFGPHPDIISVNAVLAACVSKWQEALRIYATLPSMELRPSIVTLNSLMNACASGLQWQFAFELWRGVLPPLQPTEATFGALLASCALGPGWQVSVALLQQSFLQQARANVANWTSTLTTLHREGQWERASSLFWEMYRAAVVPNMLTIDAVMVAWQRSSQWRKALGTMAALQKQSLPVGCGAMAALRSACEERHQASPAEVISVLLASTAARLLSQGPVLERGEHLQRPLCSIRTYLQDHSLPWLHCRRIVSPLARGVAASSDVDKLEAPYARLLLCEIGQAGDPLKQSSQLWRNAAPHFPVG